MAVVNHSNNGTQGARVSFEEIDVSSSGQRIDNFLFRRFKGVPKSRVYRAIRGGEVRINKKRIKSDYRLQEGDLLRLPPLQQTEKQKAPVARKWVDIVEKSILFEDSDLLIVNKPSGLAVHGGSGLDYGLIEVIRELRPKARRLELAHRLDRDTSGCTVIAKKSSILKLIHQQLREKTVEKHYLALVRGRWPKRKQVVDVPLEKNILKSGERMVSPGPEGKPSRTFFNVEEVYNGATLIKAMPQTGRTHQIRVHAREAGFPLCGDEKYGNRLDVDWEKTIGLSRLFLHASEIAFALPNGEKLHICAPLPEDLQNVLNNLKRQA